MASAVKSAFDIDHMWTGIFQVVLLGLIIFGGIKAIAVVAEYVVPFMAIGYILVAIVILVMNYARIPEIFALIISSAFGAKATFAGIIGAMISIGVKRGVYSNEAGQGTGAHAAAAAEVSHPAKQGLVQAFSVYIDTLFVCSATAFMILVTGMYNVKGPDKSLLVDNGVYYIQDGIKHMDGSATYTQAAIDKAFSGQESFHEDYVGTGSYFVAIALFFFAFTTLMAYYYIAETNVSYLTQKSGGRLLLMFLLKMAILAAVFFGCIRTAKVAWDLGDMGVGIMAWLNVIAIIILQRPAILALKDYEKQKAEGKDPVFNPVSLGIRHADFWEKEYVGNAVSEEKK
jgi:AGCS family alanine or glycine:cation symporter